MQRKTAAKVHSPEFTGSRISDVQTLEIYRSVRLSHSIISLHFIQNQQQNQITFPLILRKLKEFSTLKIATGIGIR